MRRNLHLPVQIMDDRQSSNTLAVNNLKEYLKIPSEHPNINYDDCVTFLQKQAKSMDLPISVLNVIPRNPIVVITWEGKQPNLPSILLNSHMDVVPADEKYWTHKPFAAEEVNGKIYSRGSQDTKTLGMQHLEAIRRLKNKGISFARTINVSFMPDEEVGGAKGMAAFVKTEEFKKLNVGFSIDEGMGSSNDDFIFHYGERSLWFLHIHCPGDSGHGSLLLPNTAGGKVANLLKTIYKFRDGEIKKLKENPKLTLGDVTSVNITKLEGGVQNNVLPPEFIVTVDCRVPITIGVKQWEETLNDWCKDAGTGVYIEYEEKGEDIPFTKIDSSNPYWLAFKEATDSIGLKLRPTVAPGGTDNNYIRKMGIPGIGFSAINNTTQLSHGIDEYIGVETFLNGIDIYMKIIQKLASLGEIEKPKIRNIIL